MDSLEFHLKPPSWDSVLGDELPFGAGGEEFFYSVVNSSKQYLEFGSGSSTFAVAKTDCSLVTVESDRRFLAAVERRCRGIRSESGTSQMVFLHGDIGRTGPWGKPILPQLPRPQRWRRYPLVPWEALGSGFRADTILVDGRFRVACALAVVLHQWDSEWTLIVDDFVGRPEYEPIAEYARLVGLHGRMAQFSRASHVQRIAVESAFAHYVSDWR